MEVEEWCTNVNVKHDHQTHIYCRYRDDILIVYGEDGKCTAFLEGMRRRAAATWSLKLEATDEYNMKYLDIEIWKGTYFLQDGLLQYKPYIK